MNVVRYDLGPSMERDYPYPYPERESDPNYKTVVTVDCLTVSLLLSTIFYFFCLVLVKRKITKLHQESPEFGTKKLLLLSVGVVCLLRIMSFSCVIALDFVNLQSEYSLQPVYHNGGRHGDSKKQERNQDFYDEAMAVLFDLPNCVVVSTYVLLTLVWAECYLLSRFHTEDPVKWRTRWLSGYMFFNAALYSTQMLLYVLVFFLPGESPVNTVRTLLYVAITTINFAAVLLSFALYVSLGIIFAGFPYRSRDSRNAIGEVSYVIVFWSITRILWGITMLVLYVRDIDLLRNDRKPLSYVWLFLLFLVCEIVPMFVLLDYSYTTVVGFESSASREMRMLASGQPIVSFVSPTTTLLDDNDDDNDERSLSDKSDVSMTDFDWNENHRSLFGADASATTSRQQEQQEPLLQS